jgi:hypothetical protein
MAAMRYEAGVKATACSRVGGEAAVYSGAGIEDNTWHRWHDGF